VYADFQRQGAVAGWFGCDINKDEFRRTYHAKIYPKQQNVWIVGKRKGAPGTIDKILEEFLEPVNTAFLGSNVQFAASQSPSAQHVRQTISNLDRSVKQRSHDFETPPDLGPERQFYVVLFNTPLDAPSEIGWPIKGCPEKADWALLWVTDPAPIVSEPAPVPDQPISDSKEAVEKRRKEAVEALERASSLPATSGSTKTPWLWYGITAAVLGGAGYLVWQRNQVRAPQLR